MSSFLPNTFAAHIDKAAIQALPLTYFEGEVIVADKPEMVADAAAYLRQHTILGRYRSTTLIQARCALSNRFGTDLHARTLLPPSPHARGYARRDCRNLR